MKTSERPGGGRRESRTLALRVIKGCHSPVACGPTSLATLLGRVLLCGWAAGHLRLAAVAREASGAGSLRPGRRLFDDYAPLPGVRVTPWGRSATARTEQALRCGRESPPGLGAGAKGQSQTQSGIDESSPVAPLYQV